MIYDTKTILELHITQGQLESPEKQNAAQLTVIKKTLFHCILIASRSRATVKFHCTTVLFSGPYEAGTEQFRLCVCFLEKRSLGFFGFVFDSFLFSSSV